MKNRLFLMVLTTFALGGCAHSIKHGTIAMKESDGLAHVSIHDVKEGDRVILFHNRCAGGKESAKGCTREKDADGTVKKVFSDHYSLVEFPAGTSFKEGDSVETF